MSQDQPAGFGDHISEWIRHHDDHGPCFVELLDVSGYGTDWDGDTEGGFYSTFSVEIRYLDKAGKQQHWEVVGEDMDSLWKWVVGAWPPLPLDLHGPAGGVAEPADGAGEGEGGRFG